MQRILFHKIHDIKNKLLIIIHADKMNVKKKRQVVFVKQNLELFLEPFTLKTKGHLMVYFHQRSHCQTQEQIIFFPRKKITKEPQDFKSKLF